MIFVQRVQDPKPWTLKTLNPKADRALCTFAFDGASAAAVRRFPPPGSGARFLGFKV